jgi:SAM-dependent methyltransferase
MSESIINLPSWLTTPPGQALLRWEQAQLDTAVADVFGYHALQLGMPQINALQTNRMPHRWHADREVGNAAAELAQLYCDFEALPFPEASLDLVALPHALEVSLDAHASLREAARVLVPEGRVVITGFNPSSLWGFKQRREHLYQRFGMGTLYLPEAGEFLGYWRLRDWLRLLGFEVESSNFGLWHPAVRSEQWLSRTEWMNRLGARYWPIFGAAYCVVAVKRVRGMRLMSASWKRAPQRAGSPVPVAQHSAQSTAPPPLETT